jgi:nucleoid DNA-binding protein
MLLFRTEPAREFRELANGRGVMLTGMTKQQLIEQVASSTGQSKADVERTLEAIVEKTAQALVGGEKVEFRGLGTLVGKETKARTGRNPSTGEKIDIPASRKASFRPSKELKDRLAGKRGENAPVAAGAEG